MKLSLSFIAKKLSSSYDVEALNEDPGQKFGTVRLFDSELSTSSKYDPIVIVPAQLDALEVSSEFKGVVWIGELKPRVTLPTIWIKERVRDLVILDRIQNLFDMHNIWCDSVRSALLAHETFADVVPLLSHVTINPYYYADASLRTLSIKDDDTLYASSSSWRMQSEIGRHPVEILSKFVTSGELDTVNERHDAWLFDSTTFHTPFVSRTIFCQGDVFGHLFTIEAYPDQTVFDIEILEEFGNLLERHLDLSAMSYSSSGRPFEPMLINRLEDLQQNDVETDYLLKLLSWRRDDRYRVIVFKEINAQDCEQTSHMVAPEVQAIEDNITSSRAFLHKGNLVCIVNDNRPEAISTEDVVRHLCERFNWKAAISGFGSSFDTVRVLHKHALATLEAGMNADDDELLYRFEDYRLEIVFSALSRYADEDFLMHDDLRTLIAYDEQNNAELVYTMKTYLDNERNSSRTADELHLHRNSVAYRLDKIRSLTTGDLDDPENRLFLMLSIYIWLKESSGTF